MTEEQTTPVEATTEVKTSTSAPKDAKMDAPQDRSSRPPRKGGRRVRKEREPKEFEEAILQIDRVTRVTKGGRQLRFRVSVVIGDMKGRVGFGIGKSSEVLGGIQKAIAKAKQNMITVPIFNGTIPHHVMDKFKASQVYLLPAAEGKGVIAGGAVRKILELAGVKDVLSKVHGSRNKINVSCATFSALAQLTNEMPIRMKDMKKELEEEGESVDNTLAKEETQKNKPAAKKPAAKKTAPKKSA